MKNFIFIATIFTLSCASTADKKTDALEMLATAKYTGACGIYEAQYRQQEMLKTPGGKKALDLFWAMEATRLGMTITEWDESCARVTLKYKWYRDLVLEEM